MFQASEDRQAGFDFLSSLEEYLNRCLPGPAQLVEQIRTIVEESKRTGQTPQTNFPEGAFLNRFIVPHLHEFLAKRLGKKTHGRHFSLNPSNGSRITRVARQLVPSGIPSARSSALSPRLSFGSGGNVKPNRWFVAVPTWRYVSRVSIR